MIILLFIILVIVAYLYFKQYDLILDAIICRYKCASREPCIRPEEDDRTEIFYPGPTAEGEDEAAESEEPQPPGMPARILNKIARYRATADQAGTSDEQNCSCRHYACEKIERIGRILDPFAYVHFFDTFTYYFCNFIEKYVVTMRPNDDPSPLVYSNEITLHAMVVESKDSQTNIVFDTPERRKLYLKLTDKASKEAEEKKHELSRKLTVTIDPSKKSVDIKEDKLLFSSTRRASGSKRASVSDKDKIEPKANQEEKKE